MKQYKLLQKRLLSWYRKNRRDLPWRRTQDPYAIWISEIMLQQTTVETVIPYYEKFLKRFPSLSSLASAGEEDVLQLWSGLGYYSRARNLYKAARQIQGTLPSSVEELQKLPGIGRYTAGAIASIAFQKKAPLVDGNVIRVLSRLFFIVQNPKTSKGQSVFWKKAEEILPEKNAGDFNQSLMELGATLCLPENPLCLVCPVNTLCKARKNPDSFPRGKKKQKYHTVLMTAAVIQKNGKILMIQRPEKGILKGLWEIPMAEGDLSALLKKWPIKMIRPLPGVRHSILNHRLQMTPWMCSLKRNVPKKILHQWIYPDELSNLPTSSMNKKIFQIAGLKI